MKKAGIFQRGLYIAKVSGKLTVVRVDRIRESLGRTVYDVVNLRSQRGATFGSAGKFRRPALADDLERYHCTSK